MDEIEEKRMALARQSELYKMSVEYEVERLKREARDTGTKMLIIGGTLAATYLLTRALFFKKDTYPKAIKSEPRDLIVKNPKKKSAVVAMIQEQIALFIMSVIKHKLNEYMNGTAKNKK